jgi:hypothetical protein
MTTDRKDARREAMGRLLGALDDLGIRRPFSHVDFAIAEFCGVVEAARKRADEGKAAAASLEILLDGGNVTGTVQRDLRGGKLLSSMSCLPDGRRVEGKQLPGELAVRAAHLRLESCMIDLGVHVPGSNVIDATAAWHGAVRACRETGAKVDVQITIDAGRVEEVVLRNAKTGALIDSTVFRPNGDRLKGDEV